MRSSSSTSSCCGCCRPSSRRWRSTRSRWHSARTRERFRDCFYRPLLSSTSNYERWLKQGGKDATARAGEICARTLEEYTQPPMDGAVRDELADYVARRRAELGD